MQTATHAFNVGDRVLLLKPWVADGRKYYVGTVAEQLQSVHGPRYGIHLDGRTDRVGGQITTDFSEHELTDPR